MKRANSSLKPGFIGILVVMVALLVASCVSTQLSPATGSPPAPLPTQISLNRNATSTFVSAPTADEEGVLDSSTRSKQNVIISSTRANGPMPVATASAEGGSPVPLEVESSPTLAPTVHLNRATMTLPTSTSEPTPLASDSPEAQVVALINQERTSRGLTTLTMDARLMAAVRAHSQDMASHNFFDHTGSDGSNPGDRITRQGYQWMFFAENLACEYFTPEDVVQAWLDSPGHRANMLAPEPEHIGIGVVAKPGADCSPYWTAVFAAGG